MTRRRAIAARLVGAIACLIAVTPGSAASVAPEGVPAATLARTLKIETTRFRLANGLRVVVHTDRKAPIVAVAVDYGVGSSYEPPGQTGVAHLFEHLMFNGTENAPGDGIGRLRAMGATDQNGITALDSTIFFETVPVSALERTLFLESDRMGHLLGAITPALFDKQRGIVENEKRQREGEPYGLARTWVARMLFGKDHPYGHSTMGAYADLEAQTIGSARRWFRAHYAPNNAVLVLDGDIDIATARRLAERYFAAIPRGPVSERPPAPPAMLAVPVARTMTDRVADISVERDWITIPADAPDAAALEMAAGVLNDSTSLLNEVLVRREKLATAVSASAGAQARAGWFSVSIFVAPGVDPQRASRRADELIARFLRDGPSRIELDRVARRRIHWRIQSMQSVSGQLPSLAEDTLLHDDPDFTRKRLVALAELTPSEVRATAARWLRRPSATLTILPGPRAVDADVPPAVPARAAAAPPLPPTPSRAMPPLGAVAPPTFPPVERASLSNGIPLVSAQRSTMPMTQLAISFDAGDAATSRERPAAQALLLAWLNEGTGDLDRRAIAGLRDRLALDLSSGIDADRTMFRIAVPTANLASALDLLAALLRHPALRPADLARVRAEQADTFRQRSSQAQGAADRLLPSLLFGATSPYSRTEATLTAEAVDQVTATDAVAFRQAWLRPDKATIFVVSDLPPVALKAAIDARFGDWQGVGAPGVKPAGPAAPPYPSPPPVTLVDRPGADRSLVLGYRRIEAGAQPDRLSLTMATQALGGGFDSRINADLRETRHWSYGVSGDLQVLRDGAFYVLGGMVQADHTADAVVALAGDVDHLLTDRPITAAELARLRDAALATLPSRFETGDALLSVMMANDLYGRPDDYYATIADRYAAVSAGDADAAIRRAFGDGHLRWIIVGDATRVKPALQAAGFATP